MTVVWVGRGYAAVSHQPLPSCCRFLMGLCRSQDPVFSASHTGDDESGCWSGSHAHQGGKGPVHEHLCKDCWKLGAGDGGLDPATLYLPSLAHGRWNTELPGLYTSCGGDTRIGTGPETTNVLRRLRAEEGKLTTGEVCYHFTPANLPHTN